MPDKQGSDEHDEDYQLDDVEGLDEDEEAIANCSGFFDGGVFVCMAVGSEDCEWECPMNRDLGLTIKQIQRRDMREMGKALAKGPQP